MVQRQRRRKRDQEDPPAKQEDPEARQGWVSLRTAILVIAAVSLLNAANVYGGVRHTADLTTMIAYVLLAFVTPPVAAGLAYVVFQVIRG